MNRDEGLASALFALVIGGAVAIAIAADITAPICEAAKIATAAPEKIQFGCLEFWLNRYQTLAAALIGAGVAIYVVRPVFKQLREMSRQSAAAMRSAQKDRLVSLETEAARYAAMATIVAATETDLDTVFSPLNGNKAVSERVRRRIDELEAIRLQCTIPLLMTEDDEQVSAKQAALKYVFKYIVSVRRLLDDGSIGRTFGKPKTALVDDKGKIIDVAKACQRVVLAIGPDVSKAAIELQTLEEKMRG